MDFDNYVISQIHEGKWSINYEQFSFKINFHNFSRTVYQNELRAVKTQIRLSMDVETFSQTKKEILNSDSFNNFDQSHPNCPKERFLYHYYKMKRFKKIIQFLVNKGINYGFTGNFSINNDFFEAIETRLKYLDEDVFLSYKPKTFKIDKLKSNSFRNIGNLLQNYTENDLQDLIPYVLSITGQFYSNDKLKQLINDFFTNLSNDELFDSVKMGYNFCNFMLQPSNVEFQKIRNDDRESNYSEIINNSIPKLKQSFSNAFYSKNLLFVKVCRPAHCYHCIKSIPKLLTYNHRNCEIFFNERTLIFCKNGGNFAEQIQEIPKSSNKDSNGSSSSTVYFIIHPETLNEEDNSLLEQFISTRICYLNDTDLPKVIIVSSSSFSEIFSSYSNEFKTIKFEIDDEKEIEALYQLSLDNKEFDRFYNIYLYKSQLPGVGKTYEIIKKMESVQKKLIEEYNDKVPPESIFIDANMKYLPDSDSNIVHFDLSPELFDEKFGFFDDLWIFCNLHYHILPNGKALRTPKYLFFEVPALTSSQYDAESSIRNVDFPIAIPKNNIFDIKSNEDKILLPQHVKDICAELFENDRIEKTCDLLRISLKMFYKNVFDDSNEPTFDLRILYETNLFLERFSQDLNLNDEFSQAIFLLLLRTNLHIWTMNNILDKNLPNSFIIASKQSLFGNEPNRKWCILIFASSEGITEWETKYLKREIVSKLNENISDSTLLNNEFFGRLKNDDNVDIYSNLLVFQANQIEFFKIISSLFLVENENEKNSDYTDIIDYLIMSMYNDFYGKDDFLPQAISYSFDNVNKYKIAYLKEHKDFSTTYNIILDIAKRQIVKLGLQSFDDIHRELQNKLLERNIKPISMIFTVTFIKRFAILAIRIFLGQPLILEGFTGVGKTAIVHLLSDLISFNANSKFRYHQIDCHGGLSFSNIQTDIFNNYINNCANTTIHQIFFFDELNTSPASNYVINYVNNFCIPKNFVNIKNRNATFIAAINPYIEVSQTTRDLSRVGIKQVIPTKVCKLKLCNVSPNNRKDFYEIPDLNKLAYNVRELSASTRTIILKSDPETFYLKDEDRIDYDKLLPPDEKDTIKNLIIYYLKLIPQVVEDCDDKDYSNELDEEYTDATINIIYNLICRSFLFTRKIMDLRSIISYRDVKRFMMHFLNFYRKHTKIRRLENYLNNNNKSSSDLDDIIKEYLNVTVQNSIIYSLLLSIVFRFSSNTKLPKSDESIISDRFRLLGLDLVCTESNSEFIFLNLRSSLLEYLGKFEWGELIKNPCDSKQWVDKLLNDKSKRLFEKYANYPGIFKLNTLATHLFAINSCYSVSKHFKNEPIMPCIIIGMPGTSKTLAINLFINRKSSKHNNSKGKRFYSSTYLSTRASEADGLNEHYRNCAMFMIENPESMAMCVIDELGLANLNETRPLKLLHYYFDKGIAMNFSDKRGFEIIRVMSVAASNYALDFANMNRGILICTDLCSDEEFTNSVLKDGVPDTNFKNLLNELWKIAPDGKRPEMLRLRPLYFLYNTLFIGASLDFAQISSYVTSIIDCHPKDSPQKTKQLIESLNEKLTDKIDITISDDDLNSILLLDNIISTIIDDNSLRRPLCIRTKNYDCLDYIQEWIELTKNKSFNIIYHYIFPTDFKLSTHSCADHALKEIFKLFPPNCIGPNDKHIFFIIGNAPFTDALLDLLNSTSDGKGDFDIDSSILVSQNGFSIKLDKMPDSISFIFIINDDDFMNTSSLDSFPLPLKDRFDQIYIDYDLFNGLKLIKNQKLNIRKFLKDSIAFRKKYGECLVSDCTIINEYFHHFVNTAKEVKRPNLNAQIPVIFAESEIPTKFASHDDLINLCRFPLFNSKQDYKNPNRKVILAEFKKNEHLDWAIDNINRVLIKDKIFYFANYSRNNLYEMKEDKNLSVQNILFQFLNPETFNKKNTQSFNGSIKELINYLNQNNLKRAIIFTMSPMLEKLKSINEKEALIIFDQYILSSKDFNENVANKLTDNIKYLIVQSNQFNNDINDLKSQSRALVHDRHLRYLLGKFSKTRPDLNLVIIYHLKYSQAPSCIYTSIEWPAFWMESISDSPLDANDTLTIIKCILFRKEFKNNYAKLVINILMQLYLDLYSNFILLLPGDSSGSSSKSRSRRLSSNNGLYPKINEEFKIKIFKVITENQVQIDNENEKDNAFDSLFNSLKGKEYMNVDLKRFFYENVKNCLPSYLHFLMKLLISNTSKINSDNDKFICFLQNLYKSRFIQKYYKKYDSNHILPFKVSEDAPYFPELILDQVLALFDQQYTGPISEILNFIDEYRKLQIDEDKFTDKYLNNYFIPYLKIRLLNEKDKDTYNKKISSIYADKPDFYQAFEKLLLRRGDHEIDSASFHNHLQEFLRKDNLYPIYCEYLMMKSIDERPFDNHGKMVINNQKPIIDSFFKYQYLTDIRGDTTSIQPDEIKSSNAFELTTMLVLGRPFNDSDVPVADYIKKLNENSSFDEKGVENYILLRKSFIHMIYYEKLMNYLKGSRSSEFKINYEDDFYGYHYVFPENTFKSNIDVQTEEIPNSTFDNLEDIKNINEFTPQLFKDNRIFKDTYAKIKDHEFRTFKTSSKSYIKDYNNIVYPHEMIRNEILHRKEYDNNSFSEWLFDTEAPLLVRQLFATFNAIKSQNDEEIIRELTVLSLLLNPWNKNPIPILLFWNYLNTNILSSILKQDDNYNEIMIKIERANKKFKWGSNLLDGKIYYIFNNQCIKPQFRFEIIYRLDHLMFSVAISNYSTTEYAKYANMFKSLPYVHLIKDVICIIIFAEYLQNKFVMELDTLFVILNTINCKELINIGTGMSGIAFYEELQRTIENNEGLLDANKNQIPQNTIKNILLKINDIYPGLSAYEQINLYTHKIVQFYNNVFSDDFYKTTKIKLFKLQTSNVFANFDIKDIIVPTSLKIADQGTNQNNCTIDVSNFLSKSFVYKNANKHTNKINQLFLNDVKIIDYPMDTDFLGFKLGQFSESIFSKLNFKEVIYNMECFSKLSKNDTFYREKTLAMAAKCRPYPSSAPNDMESFDALAYLLVILSKAKENDSTFVFYNSQSLNKTRISQVFENLRSLQSNIDLSRARAHIKGQNIIKKTLKRIIPSKIQEKYDISNIL